MNGSRISCLIFVAAAHLLQQQQQLPADSGDGERQMAATQKL